MSLAFKWMSYFPRVTLYISEDMYEAGGKILETGYLDFFFFFRSVVEGYRIRDTNVCLENDPSVRTQK